MTNKTKKMEEILILKDGKVKGMGDMTNETKKCEVKKGGKECGRKAKFIATHGLTKTSFYICSDCVVAYGLKKRIDAEGDFILEEYKK